MDDILSRYTYILHKILWSLSLSQTKVSKLSSLGLNYITDDFAQE